MYNMSATGMSVFPNAKDDINVLSTTKRHSINCPKEGKTPQNNKIEEVRVRELKKKQLLNHIN